MERALEIKRMHLCLKDLDKALKEFINLRKKHTDLTFNDLLKESKSCDKTYTRIIKQIVEAV